MTLEELWELFPISLVEHDDKWRHQYEEIEASLRESLAGFSVAMIVSAKSSASTTPDR